MNQSLVIKISETGGGGRSEPDKFGNELQELFEEAELYYQQPQPGKIYAESIAWIIISRVADIAGIASALWVLYEKVKQRTNAAKSIYINIDNISGAHWLPGKNVTDRDAFVHEFITKLTVLKESGRLDIIFDQTIDRISIDDSWVAKGDDKHG